MRSSHSISETEYGKRYAQLKKSISTVGFIAEGSLVKRLITCGNPNCRCRNDPAQRHGPYFQLTWKRKAKTVSQFIPPSLASRYQQWIANRQKMESILEVMYEVSAKVIDLQLDKIKNKKDKAVILSVKKKLHKT
jgi:hypothetical protein